MALADPEGEDKAVEARLAALLNGIIESARRLACDALRFGARLDPKRFI
jgi:hypothetical protein